MRELQRKDKFGNNWGKRTPSNDRVSKEAADFLRLLAQARNRSIVPALRKAAVQASIARWSAMLTLAAQGQPHLISPPKSGITHHP